MISNQLLLPDGPTELVPSVSFAVASASSGKQEKTSSDTTHQVSPPMPVDPPKDTTHQVSPPMPVDPPKETTHQISSPMTVDPPKETTHQISSPMTVDPPKDITTRQKALAIVCKATLPLSLL